METRFYQTRNLDLDSIVQALASEYQRQGFEIQRANGNGQAIVQLRKESLLRSITGLKKAIGVTLQTIDTGTLVKVSVQDWADQITVGTIGMVLRLPVLATAVVGVVTQNNVVRDVMTFVDAQVRLQQPQVVVGTPPQNI